MSSFRESLQRRSKTYLLKAVASLVFYSGALRWINCFINRFRPIQTDNGGVGFPFVRRRQARNVQILGYHRVNDDRDPYFPAVPTQVFARQMYYLASNCHVLSMEDAVEGMKRADVPDNAVVVTFDDGYRDNYLNAFPILQELALPAVVFVATEAVGSGKVLWHDRVFSAFRETKVSILEGVGDASKRYPLTTLEERLFAQRETLTFLRSLKNDERVFWIDRLIEVLQVVDRAEDYDLMLTWDDVEAVHRGGISFGSHSATHPVLSKLSTERAREEIYGSKATLESKLGVPVTTFAYPNGAKEDYDERTKQILKEAGYVCAVTTTFGTNECDQDLFELRRGTPWELELPAFALKLNWYKFRSNQ